MSEPPRERNPEDQPWQRYTADALRRTRDRSPLTRAGESPLNLGPAFSLVRPPARIGSGICRTLKCKRPRRDDEAVLRIGLVRVKDYFFLRRAGVFVRFIGRFALARVVRFLVRAAMMVSVAAECSAEPS